MKYALLVHETPELATRCKDQSFTAAGKAYGEALQAAGTAPLTGVFSTRSPDRPNPLGLNRVIVREVLGNRLRIGPMEAIDGTPVADIKPVLAGSNDS